MPLPAIAGGALLAGSLLLPAIATGAHYERAPDDDELEPGVDLDEMHAGVRLMFNLSDT